MPTQKKIETVEALRDQIARSSITIAADYAGLSVAEMSQLRKAVRDAGVDMRVIKNRLFLRAAEAAGHPELSGLLAGPTAVIFGYEDIAAAARTATEYMRTARNAFSIRSGVMDGQMLSLADLQSLASLPTKPVLLSMVAGSLKGPVTNLARLLGSLLSNPPGRLLNDSVQTFNGLLEARAKQLEAA